MTASRPGPIATFVAREETASEAGVDDRVYYAPVWTSNASECMHIFIFVELPSRDVSSQARLGLPGPYVPFTRCLRPICSRRNGYGEGLATSAYGEGLGTRVESGHARLPGYIISPAPLLTMLFRVYRSTLSGNIIIIVHDAAYLEGLMHESRQ